MAFVINIAAIECTEPFGVSIKKYCIYLHDKWKQQLTWSFSSVTVLIRRSSVYEASTLFLDLKSLFLILASNKSNIVQISEYTALVNRPNGWHGENQQENWETGREVSTKQTYIDVHFILCSALVHTAHSNTIIFEMIMLSSHALSMFPRWISSPTFGILQWKSTYSDNSNNE